jgi:hypothetical protein
MVRESGAPDVQHGRGADAGTQILGICHDPERRIDCSPHEQIADCSFVLVGDIGDRRRHRVDDMEIANGQQLGARQASIIVSRLLRFVGEEVARIGLDRSKFGTCSLRGTKANLLSDSGALPLGRPLTGVRQAGCDRAWSGRQRRGVKSPSTRLVPCVMLN